MTIVYIKINVTNILWTALPLSYYQLSMLEAKAGLRQLLHTQRGHWQMSFEVL